jgi:hypothetical protein
MSRATTLWFVARQQSLNSATPDRGLCWPTPLKEMPMRPILIALLLPLALAGCLTFSSSDPSPPRDNTTVVTPSR